MKKGTFFKAKNKSLTRYTLLRKVRDLRCRKSASADIKTLRLPLYTIHGSKRSESMIHRNGTQVNCIIHHRELFNSTAYSDS